MTKGSQTIAFKDGDKIAQWAKSEVEALASTLGVDPKSDSFANELAEALADPNKQLLLYMGMPQLQASLTAGVQKIAQEWPAIVGIIKGLAPQAELYVATLYNPLNQMITKVKIAW